MAAPELDEHIEEHSSFISTPKQLLTVVVLAFLVPIVGIAMLVILVTGISRFDEDHPAMSDEAIAQRIQPVGQVRLAEAGGADAAAPAESAPAAAAPAPAAPPAQTAAATPSTASAATPAAESAPKAAAADGKAIYTKVCTVCHAAGIAGAPKTGDKAAWEPRLKQGMDVLYQSSIKGKGAMPPKGGAVQLSDADVKAAVDYMVSLVK